MPVATRFRLDSWLSDVSPNRRRSTSTGNNTKNWTRSVRHSTMRTKCWKISSLILISLSSRNTKPREARIAILPKKSKNGNQDIRHHKKVKRSSLKIWGIWCRVKENQWSIERSERWPFDSKMRDLLLKMRYENAVSYSIIAIERLMTISSAAKSIRSL